jgi:hypothetical protein
MVDLALSLHWFIGSNASCIKVNRLLRCFVLFKKNFKYMKGLWPSNCISVLKRNLRFDFILTSKFKSEFSRHFIFSVCKNTFLVLLFQTSTIRNPLMLFRGKSSLSVLLKKMIELLWQSFRAKLPAIWKKHRFKIIIY